METAVKAAKIIQRKLHLNPAVAVLPVKLSNYSYGKKKSIFLISLKIRETHAHLYKYHAPLYITDRQCSCTRNFPKYFYRHTLDTGMLVFLCIRRYLHRPKVRNIQKSNKHLLFLLKVELVWTNHLRTCWHHHL